MTPDKEPGTQKLRDMAEAERPREKLLLKGRSALTDEELIAIFLRVGMKGCNVLELAARLKRAAGSLTALGRMEAREISRCCKGIGMAKAATLAAVFELGHRAVKENMARVDMGSPAAVYEYMAGNLRYEQQENFVVLMLDTRRHLIRSSTISKGTLNRTMVHPRDVFREAIVANACSVILVHNHPSGDPTPSKPDRELTRAMVAAGSAVHIPVHDHIIIGAGLPPYYSFKEHGLIHT
ncbi:MAG: DNA repair protein RadC [Akkermansia sp.]|nr:DNA repair protein RadC [Akkermansia sp.]MBR6576189.1 DNA repair protein RadC [Akkermansia sp.]